MNLTAAELVSKGSEGELQRAVEQHEEPVYFSNCDNRPTPSLSFEPPPGGGPCLPGIRPETLGDASFRKSHHIRFPYISGEMANGIATVEMVERASRAGWLGFFGAAGLTLDRIVKALVGLRSGCGSGSWGSNLIHSPHEPELEEKTVDLYLRHDVRRVSASAFMAMRPSIVRYAATGLTENPDGSVKRRNFVFAKISRPEVARHFLSPAPEPILNSLLDHNAITPLEAALARRIPVAEDITVE